MDCSMDEYYHSGQCHKCPQCPPGQELKEDCGYGVGVSSVCGICDVRWFKEDWGSHPCALCQNCRRLNRHQIKRCTHTDNAMCGNCSSCSFYSKIRLDGLQDLECLPCGPAPFRNIQCSRGEATGAAKFQTSAPPIQNVSSIVTACAATAILTSILFAIVCVTYQTRASLRKTCKCCLSVTVSNSHQDSDAASVPITTLHTVMQDAEVDTSNPCPQFKDPCTLDDITTTTTSDLGLNGCEVLHLVRSSACTDPATGVIMQATETPEVSFSDSALSRQHAILTLVGGQSTVRPCCAVEQQTAWGLHAPVECTELDLQHLSTAPELQTLRPS
uniref:Ectodysplasin A2 receptor n=1 Tax=Cyprinus carpio TaxID=7962 RepID=A0A8C2G1F3_CYPCA